jgi:seryl-tRNA synthetase
MSVCGFCHVSFRLRIRSGLYRNVSATKRWYTRPTFAPKPTLNLKHIRQNPGLYEQNCIDRNYAAHARNGWKILEIHERMVQRQRDALALRQRNNVLGKQLKQAAAGGGDAAKPTSKELLMEEARNLKGMLAKVEKDERGMQEEMERLALELPNLSSQHTPAGHEPEVLGYINGDASPVEHRGNGRSHVDIGRDLDLLDFEASTKTSGWGWYFLKNEAALLEQALIQYALSVAMKRGWQVMTPPSLVYSHIASACGFMPRDQNGETQIYNIAAHHEASTHNPHDPTPASLVLAGTAEIPFAGSQANKTFASSDLPVKVIGPSRCYRAEAGARGVDTKGLYRVHEFTKVEMFAWTAPPPSTAEGDRFGGAEEEGEHEALAPAEDVFLEMVEIQKEILSSLGLHARILEMPMTDLGASASRKIDIEAFFPSRTGIDGGYGEVTSASICTDYQARRLNTKVKGESGNVFAHTVNGTALAVPRVLGAVLEDGWDEESGTVVVPRCLRKWMPGEMERIFAKPGTQT